MHFYTLKNRSGGTKGFTFVEILIIAAIVGMLAAVVAVSAGAGRAKARDERRQGDLRLIQIGLGLYYDVNRRYPPSVAGDISDLNVLVTDKYLPSIPTDPMAGSSYEYLVTNNKYCLGATLERVVPADSSPCTSKSSGSTANYKVSR